MRSTAPGRLRRGALLVVIAALAIELITLFVPVPFAATLHLSTRAELIAARDAVVERPGICGGPATAAERAEYERATTIDWIRRRVHVSDYRASPDRHRRRPPRRRARRGRR